MTEPERDQYIWDLECPACKLKGFAKVSEYSYPDMRGLLFRVEETSPGFRVSKQGHFASDTEIICTACSVVV